MNLYFRNPFNWPYQLTFLTRKVSIPRISLFICHEAPYCHPLQPRTKTEIAEGKIDPTKERENITEEKEREAERRANKLAAAVLEAKPSQEAPYTSRARDAPSLKIAAKLNHIRVPYCIGVNIGLSLSLRRAIRIYVELQE